MKVANTYWADARLAAQNPSPRTAQRTMLRRAASAQSLAYDEFAVGASVAAFDEALPARSLPARPRRIPYRGKLIPSWAVFATIVLATFAICVTVTMRTQAALKVAERKYEQMNSDVESLRHANAGLARDIRRLKTDPRAIETVARERLNMVRAGEMVVPVR